THFTQLLQTIADDPDLDRILDYLRHDFVVSRPPELEGQLISLWAADDLTRDSIVGARKYLMYLLEREEHVLRVTCHSREITLPILAYEPATFALRNSHFTVRELPGPFDDPSKVNLIKRLVQEGLVQIHRI